MENKIIFEIPATKHSNPRNSEGAFLKLNSGRLLFLYGRFVSSEKKYMDEAEGGDYQYGDIAQIYSDDEGETWSSPEVLFRASDIGAVNLSSVSLLRLHSGEIALFYLIKNGMDDCRPVVRLSQDEAESWGNPIHCSDSKAYWVVNNDRVIQLKSGRVIVPACLHTITFSDHARFVQPQAVQTECSNGVDYVFYSDDNCRSWNRSANGVELLSNHSITGLQEPGCIEKLDGTLWFYARTDLGRQYEFFSSDKGETFSLSEPSIFTSPCAPLSMKRCPNGKLLAVWNPVPFYQTRNNPDKQYGCYGGRSPLVYAVSDDDGMSWGEPIELERNEYGAYQYATIFFTEKKVFLAYSVLGSEAPDGIKIRLRILTDDILL